MPNLTLEQELQIDTLRRTLESVSKEQIIEEFCNRERTRYGEKAFFMQAIRNEYAPLAEQLDINAKLRSRLQNYTKEVENLTYATQNRIRELQIELLEAKAVQAAMKEDLSLIKESNSELLSLCDRAWGFLQEAKREDNLEEILRLVGEASRSLPGR